MVEDKNYTNEDLVVLVQPDSVWRSTHSSYLGGMGLHVESYQHESDAKNDLTSGNPITGISHKNFSEKGLLIVANQGPEALNLVKAITSSFGLMV